MIDLKNPRTFSRPPELTAQISSQALIGNNTVWLYFNCTLKELLRPSVYDFSFWHTGWQIIFFFPLFFSNDIFTLYFPLLTVCLSAVPNLFSVQECRFTHHPSSLGRRTLHFCYKYDFSVLSAFKKTFSLSVAICWLEDNAGFISPEALEGDLGCKSN